MTREEKSKKLTKQVEREEKIKRRNKIIKKVLKITITLMIIIFALLYYMRFVETKMLIVKEVKVESEKLPSSFNGFKIVHISDIHYNMTTGKSELKKIVNEINRLKPDIVVITGDLLDNEEIIDEDDINDLKELLNDIDVEMNKYYIKGNHDYIDYIDDIYKESGFVSLNNKNESIYIDNDYINISGFGSSIKDDFNNNNINTDVTYNIALIHEPDNIEKIINNNYDLVLAGHSHSLQINIPFIKKLYRVTGCKNYYETYYKINNTSLYINQGIGTTRYRLRLFNPPTINFYRLMTK